MFTKLKTFILEQEQKNVLQTTIFYITKVVTHD